MNQDICKRYSLLLQQVHLNKLYLLDCFVTCDCLGYPLELIHPEFAFLEGDGLDTGIVLNTISQNLSSSIVEMDSFNNELCDDTVRST